MIVELAVALELQCVDRMQAGAIFISAWSTIVAAGCSSGSRTTDAAVDDLVAACEADVACALGATGFNSANECLFFWTQGHPLLPSPTVQCLAAAEGNCATARACIGKTRATVSSCPMATSCMGDTLSQCISGVDTHTDCTASGMHCLTTDSFSLCAVSTTCTADSCDGTKRVQCESGFGIESDCADIGETCALVGPAPSPAAVCRGTGAACTASGIDGNSLVFCDAGFEHRVDCATVVAGGTAQRGTMPNKSAPFNYCGMNECTPSLGSNSCKNNQLTVCAFGMVHTVDCTALGYAGCDNQGHDCVPTAL